MTEPEEAQAKRAILDGVKHLWNAGGVMELRAFKTKKATQSGYFDDPIKLAKAAYALDREGVPGSYLTLNPVDPALCARAPNVVEAFAKATTQDDNILRRTRLLVDIDPKRPAGISATDVQHDAALARARDVQDYLRDRDWPEALLEDSGNGAHVITA